MLKYPEFLETKPPPPTRRGWWRYLGRHLPGVSVVLMVILLIITVLYPYVVITVPSGKVGVVWKRFNGFDTYCWCFVGRGTILNPAELREEGLHVIWPWDKLFLYNLRLQSATETYNAISSDGVVVTAQINVRYQLLHNSVAVLHKFIGPAYLDSVIGPEIGSQAREVISQYSAQEVYTSRDAIQSRIRANSQKSLGANLNKLVQPEAMEQPDPKHYNDFLQHSIQILDTLVLSIELPPQIVSAINRQTEQFYEIQEYKYRVEREAQESKRKQIEANGIAAFQRTVSQGISDSYLRWRGIEATLLLAQSQNAKTVIIGSGKDGLPIILGNVDAPPAAGPVNKPGPPGTPPSNGASPASSERARPDVPPAAPNAPPDGSSALPEPSARSSREGVPPAPDKMPTADSATAPGSPEKPAAASPRFDIESLLSRIPEALRPSALSPGTGSGAPAKP